MLLCGTASAEAAGSARLGDQVNDAESDGYVFVPLLMTALAKFQASEPAMDLYFPTLVKSIGVHAEVKRLQAVRCWHQRLKKRSLAAKEDVTPSGKAESGSDAQRWQAGHRRARSGGGPEEFELALTQSAQSAARYPWFGGCLSAARKRRSRPQSYLRAVVWPQASGSQGSSRPDPVALAWSHIYLGRMDDLKGDRENALAEYHAALAVADAPESARLARPAEARQAYEPAGRNSSPG